MLTLKDLQQNGWESGINQVVMADCLEAMKLIPDKSIDLILTDPPYGIGMAKNGKVGNCTEGYHSLSSKRYGETKWDNKIPTEEVFKEMFRISRNQIIFGGNYFVEFLTNSRCWIVWHKKVTDKSNFSDCELAWTSFKTSVRYFQLGWVGLERINNSKEDGLKHPTQKPVELMRWVLENYSKPTDLILDPFMGSWTTARACKDLGRNFIGFELEEDYCKVGEERLRQENLF